MIQTSLTEYQYELNLVADLFPQASELPLHYTAKQEGKTLTGTLQGGGEEFTFTQTLPDCDELHFKRLEKRFHKLAVYRALKTLTGHQPAWGALTGIRPVKLAYMEQELGHDPLSFLQNEMDVTQEKVQVVKEILQEQEGIYQKGDENYNLFVSIPFCPTKCVYCSFISAEIGKCQKFIDPYVDAVCKEIEDAKSYAWPLRSVYVGGGTPVSLDNEHLERVLAAIGKVDCEYTVEAGRPDCITEENLALLKKYGVTRICVNPQSFSDETLRLIGRKHTAQDIFDKYALAKSFGFDVNMDFIAGLPGETLQGFLQSMDIVCNLAPENVTVHTLSLKKGSALKEKTTRLEEGEVGDMVQGAYDRLRKAGYFPYYLYRQKYMAGNLENTGFTKTGKACVYNVDIMEETSPIVACGANAVSKRVFNDVGRIERYASPKDFNTYFAKLDQIIQEKKLFFTQK